MARRETGSSVLRPSFHSLFFWAGGGEFVIVCCCYCYELAGPRYQQIIGILQMHLPLEDVSEVRKGNTSYDVHTYIAAVRTEGETVKP